MMYAFDPRVVATERGNSGSEKGVTGELEYNGFHAHNVEDLV